MPGLPSARLAPGRLKEGNFSKWNVFQDENKDVVTKRMPKDTLKRQGRAGCLGRICRVAGACFAAVCLVVVGANVWVLQTTKNNIHTAQEVANFQADAIVVPGASVRPDGSLSQILADRVEGAIVLYQEGVAPKIIMSGDNGEASYNECAAMKRYAVARGVPSEDIFCDHAGFSTYDTMYRAKNVFGCQRVVVSTQTYHLYRALYAGEGLGMSVAGVPTDMHDYQNQFYYDIREIGARTKDFFKTLMKSQSSLGGEYISLNQSGDITD